MKTTKMRLAKIFMKFSILISVCMCVVIGVSSMILYHRDVLALYNDTVGTAVSIVADRMEGDEVSEAIQTGEIPESLQTDLELMNSIKRASNIAYMYALYYPDQNNKDEMKYVFYANIESDRAKGQPDSQINWPVGEEYSKELREGFYKAQFSGSEEMFYMTNQYNSMMITAYRTIYDSKGNPVCVVGADIFADIVTKHVRSYVIGVVILGLVAIGLGVFGFRELGRQYIIEPVMKLAKATKGFVEEAKGAESPEDIVVEVPQIKQDTELRDLAIQLGDMMQGTKDYMINLKNVTAEKERIGGELSVATQIQADMLPRTFPAYPDFKEFSIHASMDPAKEVGGDFYDFFFVDKDHLALVVADVSGKGVPAALFMVIAKTIIKDSTQSLGIYAPGKILEHVNNRIAEDTDPELFVTVWMAIIDIHTGKGMAANAGHEHPALCRADGKFELVVYRHSPAVATMEGLKFREHEFQLNPGDSLFVYTDGVAEACNAEKEFYGTERMIAALNKDPGAAPEVLLKNVRKDLDSFVKDAPQFDDITMLNFQFHG